MDKIVQGNTNNIVFLKSTDDSMIDTLVKMSGQTHEVHQSGLTVTKDKERLLLPNEGKISVNVNVEQTSVLKYNDFAFLPARNSIVFRAGDMPILNRNETIMPMSWKLTHNQTIIHPGHKYSLQTIPTLSSAQEFDVRKNQPDFIQMLEKRLEQAYKAPECMQVFKDAYGYDDYQISMLDSDNYSDEVMEMVVRWIADEEAAAESEGDDLAFADEEYQDFENEEQAQANSEEAAKYEATKAHTYANGTVRRDDLVRNNIVSHAHDTVILDAFNEVKGDMFADRAYFSARNGELYSADGKPYIVRGSENSEGLDAVQEGIRKGAVSTMGERVTEEDVAKLSPFVVTDEFIRFLYSLDHWDFARGRFEAAVERMLAYR